MSRTVDTKAALWIFAQFQTATLRGGHVHRCPVCHDDEQCEDECSVEQEPGEAARGAYIPCSACFEREAGRCRT